MSDRRTTPRPIRINDSLWERFTRMARYNRITRAQQLRVIMERAVSQFEVEHTKRKEKRNGIALPDFFEIEV